jgi:hypothetical protein
MGFAPPWLAALLVCLCGLASAPSSAPPALGCAASDGACATTEYPLEVLHPVPGSTVYRKNILIDVKKSPAMVQLMSGKHFCFSLYNRRSKKSADDCVPEARMPSVYEPRFLSVNGMDGGTIEFSAWLKRAGSNEPIAASWVSFTFESDVDCAGRFEAVGDARMAMPQVGVVEHMQHAPRCHDLWEPLAAKAPLERLEFLTQYMGVFSGSRGTLGTEFYEQSFGHGDRLFLDFVLSKHQGFSRLTEFGTFAGVTSLYLGMVARMRGMATFSTFDIEDFRDREKVLPAWLSNMEFRLGDLERVPLDRQAMRTVLKTDFLFVDGGNKLVEAYLYAGNLKVGAGLMLHDYEYDNALDRVPRQRNEVLEKMGFVPKYEEVAAAFNSCARFWVRAGEGEGFDLNDWLVDVGCNSVTHCDVAGAVMGEGATAALKRGTGEVDV